MFGCRGDEGKCGEVLGKDVEKCFRVWGRGGVGVVEKSWGRCE